MFRFLLTLSLLLSPSLSSASPLFEQLPGANSSSRVISSTLNNLLGIPGFHVADDFQLAGGGTVSMVEWWGTLRNGGSSFQITFYPDAGGNPGSPLATIPVTPTSSSVATGSPFDPVTFYSATLVTPFIAAPGTPYWISVFDAAPDARWVWLSANIDTFGGRQIQNGGATWNITDDVSFRLQAADPVPEPATFGLVAIPILGWACRRLVRRLQRV